MSCVQLKSFCHVSDVVPPPVCSLCQMIPPLSRYHLPSASEGKGKKIVEQWGNVACKDLPNSFTSHGMRTGCTKTRLQNAPENCTWCLRFQSWAVRVFLYEQPEGGSTPCSTWKGSLSKALLKRYANSSKCCVRLCNVLMQLEVSLRMNSCAKLHPAHTAPPIPVWVL